MEKILENLKKNNFEAYFVETKKEAKELTEKLLKENSTVSIGGSETLKECGITELLRSGKYNFLDRSKEGLSREDVEEIYRKTFFSDTFLCSCNALTKDGTLYNVDGNCNRVAAMLFGPKSVIVVAGKNKIVDNLNGAINRVKTVAAPKNCVRLSCETYCEKTGKCVSLNSENPQMYDGCDSKSRICANYVVLGKQRVQGRIKVIIVNEDLGY